MYWNEYFPCSSSPSHATSRESNRKYSDVTTVFRSVSPRHFQPNSGDTTRLPSTVTRSHSRRHLTPETVQSSILPSEAYQIGARVPSSSVQRRIVKPFACHSG